MKSTSNMKRKPPQEEKTDLSVITEKEWETAKSLFRQNHLVAIKMTDGQIVKGRMKAFKDVTLEDYGLNILPNANWGTLTTLFEIETSYGRVNITYHKQVSSIMKERSS